MKIADTISVNPGKSTLGHSFSPKSEFFRSNILDRQIEKSQADFLTIISPSIGTGVSDYKKYVLPLRILFASILLISGINIIGSPVFSHNVFLGITELTAGCILALGLMTRLTMGTSALIFAIIGAISLRSGITDICSLMFMFGSLIFCVTGSGKYSIDNFIRHSVFKNKIVKSKKMGYKAFHSVGL